MTTTLVLVRHGQTALNAGGRLQGRRVDEPLTSLGQRQAAAAARFVDLSRVTRVVSSPLLRARETAAAFSSSSCSVEVDPRWTELDYGSYDGLPFDAVPSPVWASWRSDVSFAPPGGESLAALRDRVWSALASLSVADDGVVVVVSHVSPIKAAVAWALGVGVEVSWRMFLDVASICRVSLGEGGPSLLAYNERPVVAG
ncbi:MAG: alpha-ribazole phosphatase [Actinomycetota bacterium]|jgi:broad specificity phosphatase PhoE|nr:alpha-ribazole phosphatase [Actinomycetota bacterium]